jgi:hypothetical protein
VSLDEAMGQWAPPPPPPEEPADDDTARYLALLRQVGVTARAAENYERGRSY